MSPFPARRQLAIALQLLTASAAWSQSPTTVGGQSGDSIALLTRARQAVDAYEGAAFRYRAPLTVVTYEPTPGRPPAWDPKFSKVRQLPPTPIGIARCAPAPGGAPCLMGRDTPCTFADHRWAHCVRPDDPRVRDFARMRVELAALIDTLAAIGAMIPGDRWVAGQRTFFLVLAGRIDDAIAAARACSAGVGWCGLLEGYALQRASRVDEARDAFVRALAALPDDEACEWTDVRALLGEGESPMEITLPCGSRAREVFEARLWWLADPSWVVPDNDRWVEHIARHVDRRIQEDWGAHANAAPDELPPFYATSSEALVRVGRHDSFVLAKQTAMRYEALPSGTAGFRYGEGPVRLCARGEGFYPRTFIGVRDTGAVVGTMVASETASSRLNELCGRLGTHGARYHFVPAARAVRSPLTASATDWDLDAGRAPGLRGIDIPFRGDRPADPIPERHTPAYAPLAVDIALWQTAYFRRGDSALLVAAFETPDMLLRDAPEAPATTQWTTGLFAFAGFDDSRAMPSDSFVVRRSGASRPRWISILPTVWDSLLVGLELYSGALIAGAPATIRTGALGRARFGVAPPRHDGRINLSDILLTEELSTTAVRTGGLDSAAARAVGTTVLVGRPSVGLFWEVYGAAPGDTATFTLTVSGERLRSGGWLSRIVGALRRRSDRIAARTVRWRDQVPSIGDPWPVFTQLDLRGLESGRYRLELSVSGAGEARGSVARDVVIMAPAPPSGS